MNTIIIIPAFNANRSLPLLLAQIREITDLPILIVDDGSDQPVDAGHIPVDTEVLRIDDNSGKGYALISGFRYARKMGYSHAITMDADLQHPVDGISGFLSFSEDIDIVIGVRDFSKGMPIHRRLSNILTSKALSVLTGKNIPDSQCGFRRYRVDSVLKYDYDETGFIFESEVIIKMLKTGRMKLDLLPIQTVYGSENSHIRHVSDTLDFIKLIMKSTIK